MVAANDPSHKCCTFSSKKANCPDFFNSLVDLDGETVMKKY